MDNKSIRDNNNEIGSKIEGDKVYNSKEKKLVLAKLSKSYSELIVISVGASSTLLVHLTLFTNYLIY